mmetsp:Transcript_39591/g.101643  ORF Transcript_39591/g.101643 Transcript_39591/m.101643 type:complete len:586 (+) Transcript_39591:88-1845(+)
MSGVDEKEEKDSQEVEEVEKDGDDVDEKEEEDDEEHSLAQAHRLAQEFWRAQDGTAAKAGYLEKKGGGAGKKRNWRRGGRRNWKKRWFVLQESILYYFPSEEETNSPLGMVKLKKYEITSEESSRKITLVAGQQDERSYEMKALSPSDYTEWCDVLSSVIEKNKHAPAKRIAEATTTYIDSSEQVLLRIPTQAIPEYSLFHVSKATLGGRRYRKSKPFVFQDTNMLLLTERNIYIFDVQMARAPTRYPIASTYQVRTFDSYGGIAASSEEEQAERAGDVEETMRTRFMEILVWSSEVSPSTPTTASVTAAAGNPALSSKEEDRSREDFSFMRRHKFVISSPWNFESACTMVSHTLRAFQQKYFEETFLTDGESVFQSMFLVMKYNRRGKKDPRILVLSTGALTIMHVSFVPMMIKESAGRTDVGWEKIDNVQISNESPAELALYLNDDNRDAEKSTYHFEFFDRHDVVHFVLDARRLRTEATGVPEFTVFNAPIPKHSEVVRRASIIPSPQVASSARWATLRSSIFLAAPALRKQSQLSQQKAAEEAEGRKAAAETKEEANEEESAEAGLQETAVVSSAEPNEEK